MSSRFQFAIGGNFNLSVAQVLVEKKINLLRNTVVCPLINQPISMSNTMLLFFWIVWLLDVLIALFGYREFIGSVFGRHASASPKYLTLWLAMLAAILLVIMGSLYFKNHGRPSAALTVVVIPLVLALPYSLFLGGLMLSGKNRWN